MDLNKAMLIGNMTRDPETRTTPQGQAVTSFSIATNRSWTDAQGVRQEKAEFHNIVAWGKLAEICGQYLSKGRKVYIEGRMQTRDWTGDDGVRRFKSEIVADNMIILDRPQGQQGAGAPTQSPQESHQEEKTEAMPSRNDEKEIKVEQIPF